MKTGFYKAFMTAAFVGLAGVTGFTTSFACADEVNLPVSARSAVSVAIYNADLALIKDTRKINLPAAVTDVNFVEVSTLIQPETALVQGRGLSVLEQNYNYDLLTPEALLDKYVGKEITVISTNPATGAEKSEQAKVLANNNGTVLRIGDRIETDFKGRFVFSSIPANLRERPTLTLRMAADKAGERDISLSYLTGGLSWKADYIAELNKDEDAFALAALVTLTNNSGVSFENAVLQLVAGEVNRVRPVIRRAMAKNTMMMDAAVYAAGANEMTEESFMDYHLYTLAGKTSILSNQTKQVSMLSAPKVKAEKQYRFDNLFNLYSNMRAVDNGFVNPAVFLKFANDEKSGLGKPLPAGTFRVYKNDAAGRLLFVGEDNIRHTPKSEDVKIKLGQAFDITAKVKVTDFQRFSDKAYQADIEITFKNAKKEKVLLDFYQNLPNGWKIVKENLASSKQNANQVLWKVPVPAEGEYVLKMQIFIAG